jgi:hypothetical protein
MLIDTSVWIDHLRRTDDVLLGAVASDLAVTHDFVIGELASGSLPAGEPFLTWLRTMRRVPVAAHDECEAMLASHGLYGIGLGWVDVHLLAAARVSGETLYTRDRAVRKVAERIGVATLE